jgi:very-short-patch-repair endonuclease
MSDRSRFSSPLKERSRELRRLQTVAEKHAWYLLRDRRTLGLKFRRRVPIGDFIVDFYCDELKLVIEIDGDVHEREVIARRDEVRDEKLKRLGCTILRFHNSLIINNPEVLIESIRNLVTLTRRAEEGAPPSPRGRGI